MMMIAVGGGDDEWQVRKEMKRKIRCRSRLFNEIPKNHQKMQIITSTQRHLLPQSCLACIAGVALRYAQRVYLYGLGRLFVQC
jgi:hypothetical protein